VWDGRAPLVTGRETVRFVPDLPVTRLVFRLWPNGPMQRREGADLRVMGGVRSPDGPLATSQPDPTTLAVALGRRLPAGRPVSVRFRWRLRVPVRPRLDRLALDRAQLRLGSFFPILAWQPGVGWATDPPTRILAEASTSPTADFSVRVRVPPGVAVLASGSESAPGRWHARAVRDFALAAGPFRLASAVAHAPAPVRVTVGVGLGAAPAPADVAREAAADLGQLARRFGPYPWPTLAVPVTADVGRSGIEYPNLIFEGAAGVERTISHELAHQWFYSLVGNDQARDPWLDEGLATYAQFTHDGITGRFANVRIGPPAAGRLGAPMTFWDRLPYNDYAAGVYLQGERAIASLGPRSLVDCALRGYVAANAYRIATQPGLARTLARVIPGAPARLRRFGARVGPASP
jgi:hypothetical protein